MEDPMTSRPPVRVRARRRAVAVAAMALVFVLPAASSPASEKEDVLWSRLRARVQEAEKRLDGVLGLSVKDLKTGASFEVRPDEIFPQASSIKLAVLYELYRQADEGKIDLGQVTRPPLPRVKGGGVLQELGDKVTVAAKNNLRAVIADRGHLDKVSGDGSTECDLVSGAVSFVIVKDLNTVVRVARSQVGCRQESDPAAVEINSWATGCCS